MNDATLQPAARALSVVTLRTIGVAKESKPRVALWLGAATWLVATTVGLALSAFSR